MTRENTEQLSDVELTNIGAELVRLAGAGNPKHPKLRKEIDAAFFIAKHSDNFRRIVNERIGDRTRALPSLTSTGKISTCAGCGSKTDNQLDELTGCCRSCYEIRRVHHWLETLRTNDASKDYRVLDAFEREHSAVLSGLGIIDAVPERPEIICLCGSSRFIHAFAIFAWELEKGGKIVLGLHLLPDSYANVAVDHQAEHEGVAAQMDELHLRKIDLSDRVIVMNIGGYVGDSTRREIAYAHKHGKPVSYLEPQHVEADL